MKLRLSVGEIPKSGYCNIDPVPKMNGDAGLTVKPIDFRVLDFFDISKDAECTEVLIDGAIDYVSSESLPSFIQYFCKKLRKYGEIHINGLDINELARYIYNDEISEESANQVLFGRQDSAWSFKNGCHSMRKVCNILSSLGITITSKKINGFFYSISGKRDE